MCMCVSDRSNWTGWPSLHPGQCPVIFFPTSVSPTVPVCVFLVVCPLTPEPQSKLLCVCDR